MDQTLTPEIIERISKKLPKDEAAELLAMFDELDGRKRQTLAQNDFLTFIAAIDPNYKFGVHLKRLGTLLMQVETNEKNRIAVSMAPRMGKSQMISIYYPAWYLGKHPDHKVIVASHTADLAVVMARKVRNLINTPEYKAIFPQTNIASDAKAAAQWNTTKGGEYFAIGVGGALAGRGAHLIIADDPLSEQDIKAGNTSSLDSAYEWFSAGLRTRLMPEGKICVLHTRWHQRDLIGRLIKDSAMNEGGDKYETFEFPAILHEGTENEKSIWPEQWSLEALQQTRSSMHHIMWQWYAQYQQNPTAAEAAIIKRDWIRWWTKEDPPKIDFMVQAFDTALTTKQRSDFSVCHTWGVWENEEDGTQNVILLNKVKGKYEFPELKQMAHDQYKEWEPDSVIVEAKASGQPLIDEMRRSGIFVQDFSPGKGQDKIARLNAVADMFASGHVWFPENAWAAATVEEILAFPAGEHDDEVDTMTLALMRIRKGGLLRLSSDHEDNDPYYAARRPAYY
jgi:predicted phage terminase large subunit-like protein